MDKMKWAYSFVMLGALMAWAVFCVIVVRNAAVDPDTASVIATAGVSVVTGALIALNTNITQYWFRKAKPEDPETRPS